ncbi:HMG domain-containing protein 3-like [Garra rufa]|uniref:HMG domain-containing protein 3-like n=1 Tax=Garra rufa TaxID=137080 RepID=UPI003CCE6BE4
MMGLIDNISTYHRICPQCNMVYRYQEWKDGVHNFDNHIFLTLELCVFLRENVTNHVSVSRVVDSLEGLRGEKFPSRDVIFQAYCHFEALTDAEYTYSCVNCGFHPPVVVMDLHRKGVFKMTVSDLKVPPDDFNGEHDVESFWNSVHLSMISRGFFQSSADNPFTVNPSYECWAPWIGSETRRSDTVLNTEFKKVRTCPSSTEAQLSSVTEDHLIDELAKQKVILPVVRKLCKACNIDTKGSRLDLITRLKENMKSRQTYDKVFQSIWGASGGWSVILCPHGIVYSIKFNIRAESPRDFADLLLSWKHLPNVCVYDFARGLAAHMNLRVPHSPPFQPYEGRLSEPTQENVRAARNGKLHVSLPWLHERVYCGEENAHPVTGSSEHYVLYDRFHEKNATDPKDILRRIQLVPELKGWLNSQVAEQFFAKMRKSNYFFNNMAPSTHAFLMRSVIHRHNTSTNTALLQRQLNSGRRLELLSTITLSSLGQAVIAQQSDASKKTEHNCGGPGNKAVAQKLLPGPWNEQSGLDVEGLPQQNFGIDCGIFMVMNDMPYLRRWWCKVLLENLGIEGHGRRFAHFTSEGKKMGEGCLPPIFRVTRKRRQSTLLPDTILQNILVSVVLEDGCTAILRLALTCQKFEQIVSQEAFQKEAHFRWLDSVVNWKRHSGSHIQEYRKPYTISRCSRLQCSQLYKDCGAGYQGNGQRGVLLGFYSSDDHPGYCSWDCYTDDGGWEE